MRVCWVMVFCAAASFAADEGAFTFKPASVDLGTCVEGDSPAQEVAYSNETGVEIVVREIEQSCRCLKGGIKAGDVLAPAAGGSLTVGVDTAGLSGKLEKHLTVSYSPTGDSRLKSATLAVTVAIVPVLAWPATNEFPTSPQERRGVIHAKYNGHEPVVFNEPTCTNDSVSCSLSKKEIAPEDEFEIACTVPDETLKGLVGGVVTLESAAGRKWEASILFRIRDFFSVSPARIFLPGVKDPAAVVVKMAVNRLSGEYSVTGVSVDNPHLIISGGSGVYELRLAEAIPDGRFSGTITFTTDHPDEPQVKVSVRGTVSRETKAP